MRKIALAVMFLSAVTAVSAEGFDLRITPLFTLPVGPGIEDPGAPGTNLLMSDTFVTGGGVEVLAAWPLAAVPFLRLGGALGYQAFPLKLSEEAISALILSGSAEVFMQPLNRFTVSTGAKAGLFYGILNTVAAPGPYLQAGAGFEFRLLRTLRIGAGATYEIFFGAPSPVYSGIGIHLGASIALGSAAAKPRLEIRDIQILPLFPVFFKWYDVNPLGSLIILNAEPSAIKNVKVEIFIREFMDAPKICMEIPELPRGEGKEVPLFALLTDAILTVTEATKVAAEITVSYDLPDDKMQLTQTQSLRVLDRNAMTWEDDRRAAAFVTAKDPALLRLSKNTAGLVRESSVGGDLGFRIALGVFQTLGLHGMTYVVDPKASYQDQVAMKESIDSLQFPRQTLQYRSGDCDDLSILYTALLESVGVETAFVTVPGHIYSAFALEGAPADAVRLFATPERLIESEGKLWVPIETTMYKDGFLAAWNAGMRQWNAAGSLARLWPIRDAWKLYEAAGTRDPDPGITYPASKDILVSFGREYNRFVDEQIGPKVVQYREKLKAGDDVKTRNSLAVLYARYGRYDEAEIEWNKIVAKQDYPAALINLANIAIIRKDDKAAAAFFERVLKKEPANVAALGGAANAYARLGDGNRAAALVARLELVDPAGAKKLAGLISAGSARASSADSGPGAAWNDGN